MTKKIVINREFGDSFTLTYQPQWTVQVRDEPAAPAPGEASSDQNDLIPLLSGRLKRSLRSPIGPTAKSVQTQPALDHDALAAEEAIREWCMEEARFSAAARVLAAVYVAAAGGPVRFSLIELRMLKPEQRCWALILINAYVAERIAIAWERAQELAELYELNEDA